MLSILRVSETPVDELKEEELDDDYEDGSKEDHITMSKAELRKSNKPIMEKRRRARINQCLNELKNLILDAMKKDPARHSKLEKADILEMTVKHLQAVQRQQLAVAVAHDPAVLQKFRGGFTECAQEVSRYVSRIDGIDSAVRQRLVQHLAQCVTGLNSMTPLTFTAMAGLPLSRPPVPSPGDVNNNSARILNVAARLAAAGDQSGAALLLHGGLSLLNRGAPPMPQPNLNETPSSSRGLNPRPSAFTAVRRSVSPLSTQSIGPQPKIVTPTARRPVIEPQPQTLVQAQVALKPVNLAVPIPREPSGPIDFSFRKPLSSPPQKRPLEDHEQEERPSKMARPSSSSEASPGSASQSPDDKDMWRPW